MSEIQDQLQATFADMDPDVSMATTLVLLAECVEELREGILTQKLEGVREKLDE